ncbi:hypothetical protein OG402_40890 [Streptomyces anulatus]|uniref:hypothetical protein n=1 Tax=Streptomyces anulatus TaxID=1892 RepID=UPI002254B051|nr:hypothetical protein [Streptomyces anulatus]MCX4606785.1 hypothetical protein [Streptomyces anulatus]
MNSRNPVDQLRAHLEAATTGPWEPGDVWLTAGLIYSDGGERVDDGDATRCAYCHLGEPAWSGSADINGTTMPAHRHRNPEPYDPGHSVSSADGGLIAYEGGGIVRSEDVRFVVSARELVPALLSEVDGLRLKDATLRECITALHAPVQHMGQVWCGECSVRRSTGPKSEEWMAFIPHPCPTLNALDSTEATEIAERKDENPCEGDTSENGAWHSVWLHGKWESLTRRMSTAEREYAADRVASYSRHLAECDNDPDRGEPTGLRWWREARR